MIRLAYLVSQFPEAHESFIVREIQAVVASGEADVTIFSLKRCRDPFIQDEAKPLVARTVYPEARTSRGGLRAVLSTPGGRRCMSGVIGAYRGRPRELAKALVTLVRAAAFGPALRRLGARHVHAHWATMPALAAYYLGKSDGYRFSVTAHAWDIYADQTMLREKLEAAEFVVTCTAANRVFLTKTLGLSGKVVVSYHGLDFRRVAPPRFDRNSTLSILAVGRLVEQKGFHYLVQACAAIAARGRLPFSCRIIGDGPLRGSLQRAIDFRGLGSRVKLSGAERLTEVFEALRGATVFCAPSVVARNGDRDGIPNVIIEAMSQGVPVVASEVSGIPELVRPGVTGWLVPPGDTEALADALEAAVAAPAEARRRAVLAYDLIRSEFDACRNASVLLDLLRA